VPRRYRESVPLPDDVDLVAVEAIRDFVYRTIGARGPTLRRVLRALKVVCERVTIDTRDSIVEEADLPRARAGLDPGDHLESIDLTVSLPRRDARISVVWCRQGPSKMEVAGGNRVWVLGVAQSLDLFVQQGSHVLPVAPAVPVGESGPVAAWWMSREVLVQALGTVAGAGALALIGALAAAVLR